MLYQARRVPFDMYIHTSLVHTACTTYVVVVVVVVVVSAQHEMSLAVGSAQQKTCLLGSHSACRGDVQKGAIDVITAKGWQLTVGEPGRLAGEVRTSMHISTNSVMNSRKYE